MKTLKLAFAAFALVASATVLLAEEKPKKMKATKDCGTCCTQGGDCCDKCGPDKCASCCDKKVAAK